MVPSCSPKKPKENRMDTNDAIGNSGKSTVTVLFLLLYFVFLSSTALGQGTASGALSGNVVDKNGAVIKGAAVTVTNKATGLSRTATTGDNGEYRIDLLPAGRYDVKVTASGFGDVIAEALELLIGKTNNFDVTMNPGVQTANVTVTGEAELVSREKTDISLNITPRDVQDLP